MTVLALPFLTLFSGKAGCGFGLAQVCVWMCEAWSFAVTFLALIVTRVLLPTGVSVAFAVSPEPLTGERSSVIDLAWVPPPLLELWLLPPPPPPPLPPPLPLPPQPAATIASAPVRPSAITAGCPLMSILHVSLDGFQSRRLGRAGPCRQPVE